MPHTAPTRFQETRYLVLDDRIIDEIVSAKLPNILRFFFYYASIPLKNASLTTKGIMPWSGGSNLCFEMRT